MIAFNTISYTKLDKFFYNESLIVNVTLKTRIDTFIIVQNLDTFFTKSSGKEPNTFLYRSSEVEQPVLMNSLRALL